MEFLKGIWQRGFLKKKKKFNLEIIVTSHAIARNALRWSTAFGAAVRDRSPGRTWKEAGHRHFRRQKDPRPAPSRARAMLSPRGPANPVPTPAIWPF